MKQVAANKACTRQVGVGVIYKHFPRFELFLLSKRIYTRPLAGNANRWAADLQNFGRSI